MIDAETHPEAWPSASHVPSASNCFSKMRNGMMMNANISPISSAHRITRAYRTASTSFSYWLMLSIHDARGGRFAVAQ